MRHFVAHLLRCQPELATALDIDRRPPEAESDLDEWTGQLPHRELLGVCVRLVEEAVYDLEFVHPIAHDVLRALVGMPGEWDLDDALALALDPLESLALPSRDEMILAIEELLRRGLLVAGREALRFVLPFPVRFCLRESGDSGHGDREALRMRMVTHFSARAAEESAADPTLHRSWRLTNMLYAFKTAVEWLEEALGVDVVAALHAVPRADIPQRLAECLLEFGQALGPIVSQRRSDYGWRWLLGAVVGARQLQRPDVEADLFRGLGHYYRQNDRLDEALDNLDRARRLYLSLPDPHQACLMSGALALTHKDLGNPESALAEFEHAWMMANEHGLHAEKASIANCAGGVCLHADDPDRARQWFLRGWEATEAAGSAPERAELALNLGRAIRRQGDLDTALHWFAEAREHGRRCNDRPVLATALAEIAALWEKKEDPAAAVLWLEQALHLRADLGDGPGQAALLRDLARCARLDQRNADARDYAQRARSLARRYRLDLVEGGACLELAELALTQGDAVAATDNYIVALERLGATAPAPLLARTHLRLALVLYRRGTLEESARHLLSAQALARHARLEDLLAEVDPWLAVLSDQLGLLRFDMLVERVTELWEAGGLGGGRTEEPRGGVPR